MMSLSRFRLITFDVTDTLLQFRTTPAKKYGEIGAMFGILVDDDALINNFKFHWHKMNRAHPNFGLKTKIGYTEWWRRVVIGTFGDHVPEEKVLKFSSHILETFKTSACWQHCYGAIEFLNYLKLQQHNGPKNNPPFKLGIISNFDPRLDVLLRNMKVNHYFDFVLSSYDCGFEKPDKKIFEKAMEASELKDLDPKECLHIGDTPITDYMGARKAGWYSLLLHEKNPERLRAKYGDVIEDHHVFSSLFDMHKKISNDYMKW